MPEHDRAGAIEVFETLAERFGEHVAREVLRIFDGTAPPRLGFVDLGLKRRRFAALLEQYPDRRTMSLRRLARMVGVDPHTARRWLRGWTRTPR